MSPLALARLLGLLGLLALLAALAALATTPASAHETREAGGFRLTIGWAEEPAYRGAENAVEVTLTTADGAPVTDLGGGALTVEASVGDDTATFALQPGDRPGVLVAPLVPTRVGTYTFHVSGLVQGNVVDATSTCSPQTFDCVVDPVAVQFPAREPSAAEAMERIERGLPRAEGARGIASDARLLAFVALGVAAGAVAVAVVALRRVDS
jgi:hypothetical protein